MQVFDYLQHMGILAAEGKAQGVFFWAAVYTQVLLLYSLVFQFRVSAWPSVVGELLDERITEFGYASAPSSKEYRASVSYRYVVDGKEYIGKRLSPWLFITNYNAQFILKKQMHSVLRDDSGAVEVYYNPRKPGKSFLIKPGLMGKAMTVLLSIIPLLLYVQKYYG